WRTNKTSGSAGSAVMSVINVIPRKARIVGVILLTTFFLIFMLNAFKPQAEKRAVPETVVKVEVVEVNRSDYPITVNTNGTIQAETRGNLVAQIRGEIVSVADNFRSGGSFEKGDVLIEIDQRDYLAELSQASASVSQAKASFRQEQANAKQAANDWDRLGNTGEAPDLVLRKPQLDSAKAQLDSANARLQTAKLNLARTKITAPYAGRVIRRSAVLGQYVGIGTPIAEVFSTNQVEVRLPLSQTEFNQLGLDSAFLSGDLETYKVTLNSQVGINTYSWDAELARSDSTFDLNTRQIDVFAIVIDPFSMDTVKPALKIGQFVNAEVQGQVLQDVVVVPSKALREGSYVFTSVDNKLQRTPVKIAWQDDQNALIESGLDNGDLVVTTSLNSTLAGASVKLPDEFNTESLANSDANPAPAAVAPAASSN
ncbi:MAG: efflux RND transporter periplasmic adaptor subunit, partial [Pseudomonadota bacterium]